MQSSTQSHSSTATASETRRNRAINAFHSRKADLIEGPFQESLVRTVEDLLIRTRSDFGLEPVISLEEIVDEAFNRVRGWAYSDDHNRATNDRRMMEMMMSLPIATVRSGTVPVEDEESDDGFFDDEIEEEGEVGENNDGDDGGTDQPPPRRRYLSNPLQTGYLAWQLNCRKYREIAICLVQDQRRINQTVVIMNNLELRPVMKIEAAGTAATESAVASLDSEGDFVSVEPSDTAGSLQ